MPRVKSVPKRRYLTGSRSYYKPKAYRLRIRGVNRRQYRYRNYIASRYSRRLNTFLGYNRLRSRYGYRR